MSKDILGTLVVVVLKARNLNDKHQFYKQDPFARVTLGDSTKRIPTDVKGGQHPEWDAEVRFDIPKSTSEANRTLEVSVWAEEHKQDDLLGKAKVDISETLRTGEFDDWLPLDIEGTHRGDVYLEMTYFAATGAPIRTNASLAPPSAGTNSSLAPPSAALNRRPSKLNPSERLSRPPASSRPPNSPLSNSHSPSHSPQHSHSSTPSRLGPQSHPSSRTSSSGGLSPLPDPSVPNFLMPGAGQKVPQQQVATFAPAQVPGPVPNILRPGTSNGPALRNPYDSSPPAPQHQHTLPPVNEYSQQPNRSYSPLPPQPSHTIPSTPSPYTNPSTPSPYINPSTPSPYTHPSTPSPYNNPSTPTPYPNTSTPTPYTSPYPPHTGSSTPSPYNQTPNIHTPSIYPPQNNPAPDPWQTSPGPSSPSFPVPGFLGSHSSPPTNNGYNYNSSYQQPPPAQSSYRQPEVAPWLPQPAAGRPDPYLQARYQTPLPLPSSPKSSSTPTQFPPPPVHPQHHPRSTLDYREDQRRQTLAREEDSFAKKRAQEERDLELARQLDQELNAGL